MAETGPTARTNCCRFRIICRIFRQLLNCHPCLFMKLRCIAVDDESMARKMLEENIRQIPFLELVRSCKNAFEAMEALQLLTRTEGIMPAIESAHALAGTMRLGKRLAQADPDARPIVVVCVSGRGDKDVDTAIKWFGLDGSADASVGGEQ